MAKHSDAYYLRKAKRWLTKTPDCYFRLGICAAITASAPNSVADRLKLWVRSMLEGLSYLQYWLGYRGIQDAEKDPAKLRATRLAWLDWMIQHCEEQDGK